MSKVIINSHDEFAQYIGKDIGTSDWLRINQNQINLFADATLDHQWIHCDEEKAKSGPFGTTIAHGYLTLSILPYLWEQITEFNNVKMLVNYGMDNLKFGQPVKVNDEVRLTAHLKELLNLRGISKTSLEITLEIKDQKKPAYTGTVIFLYHFE